MISSAGVLKVLRPRDTSLSSIITVTNTTGVNRLEINTVHSFLVRTDTLHQESSAFSEQQLLGFR